MNVAHVHRQLAPLNANLLTCPLWIGTMGCVAAARKKLWVPDWAARSWFNRDLNCSDRCCTHKNYDCEPLIELLNFVSGEIAFQGANGSLFFN